MSTPDALQQPDMTRFRVISRDGEERRKFCVELGYDVLGIKGKSGAVESYLIGRSGSEKLHRFKGEWSPKIAKDLYFLLSKKRIE